MGEGRPQGGRVRRAVECLANRTHATSCKRESGETSYCQTDTGRESSLPCKTLPRQWHPPTDHCVACCMAGRQRIGRERESQMCVHTLSGVPEEVRGLLAHHPLPRLPQVELEARRSLRMHHQLTAHLHTHTHTHSSTIHVTPHLFLTDPLPPKALFLLNFTHFPSLYQQPFNVCVTLLGRTALAIHCSSIIIYLLEYGEDRVVGGAVGGEETIDERMRESRQSREN